MILATITFGTGHGKDQARLRDAAETYLGALLRAGQIGHHYFLSWIKGRLIAHVQAAAPEAVKIKYHSTWGKKALRKVSRLFGQKPEWKLIEDHDNAPTISWIDAPFLYLHDIMLETISPVYRADTGAAIPLFLLPVSFEVKDQLYFWQQSHFHHEMIWLESGTLENAAYRQLSRHDSQLAEKGRQLCRIIEESTGVPTYYYLMHYSLQYNPRAEKRKCPGCGGVWRFETLCPTSRGFWNFDFKCDKCRLASHLPCIY